MSVRLVEGGIAAGFGALDQFVTSKAGTTNFGGSFFNQKWSLYLELAGVAAGLWGRKVGLSEEVRTPVGISALALLGQRGARYAMGGNLFKPGAWAGMGGDVGGNGDISPMGGGRAESAPLLKVRGGGMGGYPTYPPTSEAPGIAG
jgi:hypothetical protein